MPNVLDGRSLASISCLGDTFINFWDITKPYSVPYKRSIEQKQALIDFNWISRQELISCTNTGRVMTHSENSAVFMADSINEISLACNNIGIIQHTYKQFTPVTVPMNKSLEDAQLDLVRPQWSVLNTVDLMRSRKLPPRDRSHSVNLPRTNNSLQVSTKNPIHIHSLSSTASDFAISSFKNNSKEVCDPIIPLYKRSKEFVQFAREYRFTGGTPMELCRRNEKIAKRLEREDIGFLWYFCQCLLTDTKRLTQGVISFDAKDHQGEMKGIWKYS